MRFLRAYRRGARSYHDAFTAANGQREDGSSAAEISWIIAQYTGQLADQIRSDIAYVDAEARIDVKDVLRQIDWYRTQGLLNGPDNRDAVIDRRYAIPLPER